MCEYSSAGFYNQKIWFIKAQRMLTTLGLGDAKRSCELVMELLTLPAATRDREQAVRTFFAGRVELPQEIVAMLDHPVSWYRWAALELAAAWGLTPQQAEDLTEDRVWDRSHRVRERALRIRQG
jgi:hypothetical protein